MIYNENKIFAKVWSVTPAENGKYIDLQVTTSEKDADGNYKNSGWFPRAIGHAANSLKGVKKEDRIVITKSKFTNERYKDQNGETKSRFRFLILEASIDGNASSPATEAPAQTKKKPVEQAATQAQDDCPW